jgi:ComF family protein
MASEKISDVGKKIGNDFRNFHLISVILTHYLLDIIFPPVCFACKEYLKSGSEKTNHLCTACSGKLGYLPGFLCSVCLKRLPAPEKTCHKDAQFILASPLEYSNPVAREIIHTLKYGKVRTAVEPLAQILCDYLTASVKNSNLLIGSFSLVPIPLHPKKERGRGFNQAAVIAEKLGEKSGLPVLSSVLKKTAFTPSQTEKKSGAEREENVRDTFIIKNPELVAGKNIFLVDDVFTSGATMREAARVLKLAGAKKIIALAVARA